ncbi:MAG: hypothetical protein EOP02_39000 [Proteobacteria bacterium]|nr:MAG: hypothetical protein EOP02_39000 [Pseudomonadota bacterium]
MTKQTTEPAPRSLCDLIADDSYIMAFQTTGQYRTALLQHARTPAVQQAIPPRERDDDHSHALPVAELLHALRQAERLLRAAGFTMAGTASSQIVAAIAAASADRPTTPIAWMDPNAGCVMDAFLWQKDESNPQYSVPVFTLGTHIDGGQGERK